AAVPPLPGDRPRAASRSSRCAGENTPRPECRSYGHGPEAVRASGSSLVWALAGTAADMPRARVPACGWGNTLSSIFGFSLQDPGSRREAVAEATSGL